MTELEILKELELKFKESSSREELDSVFKAWRAQHTLPIREQIKKTNSKEEKKELGLKLKELTEKSQTLYEARKLDFSSWNIPFFEVRGGEETTEFKANYSSRNLLSEVFESVYQFLESNNFYFFETSEIVQVKENFDRLLIPESHPARAESDSYFLSKAQSGSWFHRYRFLSSEPLMLITHTTTSTLKLLRTSYPCIFLVALRY